MKVCQECNKENLVDVSFCGYCGKPLRDKEIVPEKETHEKLKEIYEGLSQIVRQEIEKSVHWKPAFDPIQRFSSLNDEILQSNDKYEALVKEYEEIEKTLAGCTDSRREEYLIGILKKTKYEKEQISARQQEIEFERFELISISDMRRKLEVAFSEVSDWPIQTFTKIVKNHLIPHHSPQLLARYIPDENRCMVESNQIQVNCRKAFNEYVFLLGELQSLQQQGKHLIPQVKKLLENNDDKGYGDIAEYVGAGALAVANPILGITLLARKCFSDNSKSKQKNEQVMQVCTQFDQIKKEYLEKWDQSLAFLLDCDKVKQFDSYYEEKSIQIIAGGIVNILKQLESSGEPIYEAKVYFSS